MVIRAQVAMEVIAWSGRCKPGFCQFRVGVASGRFRHANGRRNAPSKGKPFQFEGYSKDSEYARGLRPAGESTAKRVRRLYRLLTAVNLYSKLGQGDDFKKLFGCFYPALSDRSPR